MNEFLVAVFNIVSSLILIYFFLINLIYFALIILSIIGIYRHINLTSYVKFKELFFLPFMKPISILAPAHNEENIIVESVNSLLSIEYPRFEIIVINDGSTDSTLEKLKSAFDLNATHKVFRKKIDTKPIKKIYISRKIPKLTVIDKEQGQKADALNAALNISKYPLFCSIDCDSLLEKDSLLKLLKPFLEEPDKVVAAGGMMRLSNGCRVKDGQVKDIQIPKNWLVRFQIIEYFRAFLGGRLGLNMLKSLLIISGAFGLFRKDIALKCGGYRTNTVGEDMDLIVRIKKYLHEHKKPFKIYFIPDTVCWTEAPDTLKGLSNQRNRWHRGLIDTLIHNRKMFFNPRYGITGMLAFPFYVIFEMCGPLIEFTGYLLFAAIVVFGRVNYPFALLFFVVAVVLGVILSVTALFLEEFSKLRYPRLKDVILITLASIAENFLYRQFLSWVRTKAFFDLAKGMTAWGEIKKKGFEREN
jgi:cellulose synthase/poly-beta-1,6-N-acetylglucosamine synthase-like glycosyltransferase